MSNYLSRDTFTGLGTYNYTAPETGIFFLKGSISLPEISQGASANSQVVVTVTVNSGGAIYTGTAGAQGFALSVPCTAADVIHIALTSSTGVDQSLNAIKTTITISETT